MKGLKTLIKLRQRELDKLRQNLGKLEEELRSLITEEKRLGAELEAEIKLAAENPEMAQFFGQFAQGIEHKQDQIRALASEVNKAIANMQREITDAFGELKRLEIARDNFEAEQEAKQAHREALELDEIALQQYNRKQQTEEETG